MSKDESAEVHHVGLSGFRLDQLSYTVYDSLSVKVTEHYMHISDQRYAGEETSRRGVEKEI